MRLHASIFAILLFAACGNDNAAPSPTGSSGTSGSSEGGADTTVGGGTPAGSSGTAEGGAGTTDGGTTSEGGSDTPSGVVTTGVLDTTFGSGGVKDTAIAMKDFVNGWIRGDAVIIATDPVDPTTVSNVPVRLLKFSLDGTPDAAWNDAAKAAIAGAGNFGGRPEPWLIDVDASGRAWIVQTSTVPPAGGVYNVVRLTPEGTFDKKFLIPRPSPTELQGYAASALAIAALSDGSFVVQTGYGRNDKGTMWFISHFDAEGALVKQVQPKDTTAGPIPRALFHVAADGSIFALRTQYTLTTDTTICTVKLSASLDDAPATCFDGLKKEFYALTSGADGKLVALGNAPRKDKDAKREGLAMRFDAEGTPDPSFGVDGELRVTFLPGLVSDDPNTTFAYAWQDESKHWIFGGNTHNGGKDTAYYALWRTDENGVTDPAFAFAVKRGDIDDITVPVRQVRGAGAQFGRDVVLVPLADAKVLGLHGDSISKTIKTVRFR